jgi:aminopeptidase N
VRRALTAAIAASIGLLIAAPSAAAAPAPGAPGIGDPYYPTYGNGGYDVSHYDLKLKYQPKTDALQGTATLLATAKQDLSRFNLDFALTVSEVRVNGRLADFDATGEHELEVTPARSVAKGKPMTVVVKYSGIPSKVKVNGFTAWLRTADGGVAAGEPEIAWWWFPSNDHPLDKASYDIAATVPDGNQAISNGVLTRQSSTRGWSTYKWRSAKPQATYLATLAMGKYEITTDTTESGLPVVNAYSEDLGEDAGAARASVERTTEVADWLGTVFGTYPFTAVGGYVPALPNAGFSLETQTRPFYAQGAFRRGANVPLIVHELAHQWNGDSVSVQGWKDIWINEGFATYASWLWSEKEGDGTAQEISDWAYDSIPADDPFWQVKPGDPGPENQFHGAVYDRGAMALQALRNRVGDPDFFKILKTWTKRNIYGNASVQDFIAHSERVSGKNLGALFETWLFTKGKPAAPAAAKDGISTRAKKAERPRSWTKLQRVQETHRR